MSARLTVIAGPPQSGKTDRLLGRYRALLAENRPGAALWLAPTWRAAAEVRRRLLTSPGREPGDNVAPPRSRGQRKGTVPFSSNENRDSPLPGCFAPGVMTFEQFAETVLRQTPEPVRPISPFMKHHLIRQLIDEARTAGGLPYFASIASTGGLVELVGELIGELKRLEVWPEDFQRACAARGMTPKDRELLDLYQAYQQRLGEHQLYDAEGRFWSARWAEAEHEPRA